jgi:hypothetical protein
VRENLKRTVAERLRRLVDLQHAVDELQRAGRRSRPG